MRVISLYDYTGNMVLPWAEAGYRCLIVDLLHPAGVRAHPTLANVWTHGADMREWRPPREWVDNVAFVAAFPPCDHLAISGARWFRGKGLRRLSESIELFALAAEWCEWFGAPYLIENPVSSISTYWRKPDYTFHPWHYTVFEPSDSYTKRTCLWVGNGFVMPPPKWVEGVTPDNRIHTAPPGPERSAFRSATPMGFARAVFEANGATKRAA